jgi:hypothetical protein
MRHAVLLALPVAAACFGCSAHPPPNWARGGAPVDIPAARWTRADRTVDVVADGRVMIDGDHAFTIDRAGRVYEPDGDPIAVLQPDGSLVGNDGRMLGQIGVMNAALPGASAAWLTVGPRGEVIRYDDEGERSADGAWMGCGPAVRTCTLVTHLVELREMERRPRVGVGIGIGMGVGFH